MIHCAGCKLGQHKCTETTWQAKTQCCCVKQVLLPCSHKHPTHMAQIELFRWNKFVMCISALSSFQCLGGKGQEENGIMLIAPAGAATACRASGQTVSIPSLPVASQGRRQPTNISQLTFMLMLEGQQRPQACCVHQRKPVFLELVRQRLKAVSKQDSCQLFEVDAEGAVHSSAAHMVSIY